MNSNVHVDEFNFRLSIEMEKNARLGGKISLLFHVRFVIR